MRHESKIRALRTWTRHIAIVNVQRAANRQRYAEIMAMPDYTDALWHEAIALLVEGIDQLPLPTVSDMNQQHD